jgi:hypothetical protein
MELLECLNIFVVEFLPVFLLLSFSLFF